MIAARLQQKQDNGIATWEKLPHSNAFFPSLHYCSSSVPQTIRFGSSSEFVYYSLLVHVEDNRTSHRTHAHVSYHDGSVYNVSQRQGSMSQKSRQADVVTEYRGHEVTGGTKGTLTLNETQSAKHLICCALRYLRTGCVISRDYHIT